MALSNLFAWNKSGVSSACGSACVAGGDEPKETPTACGSACGAGDKTEETPTACGSACGAGDK